MKESDFQKSVVNELYQRFPGCVITKNDARYIQGIPDLLILWRNKWGMLECKKNQNASKRPNQDYWVYRLNKMSFASFIFPENRKEVIDDLERAFRNGRRKSRVS